MAFTENKNWLQIFQIVTMVTRDSKTTPFYQSLHTLNLEEKNQIKIQNFDSV
jgi:hypothetical protein